MLSTLATAGLGISDATLFKIEDFGQYCAQIDVPYKYQRYSEAYTHFQEGSCNMHGYINYMSQNELEIPEVGKVQVTVYNRGYKGEPIKANKYVTVHQSMAFACLEGKIPAADSAIALKAGFTTGTCLADGFTHDIGAKSLNIPKIGAVTVSFWSKWGEEEDKNVVKASGAPVALYKTELFACLEGDVPAEVSTEVMKFTGFAQGKCSDEGYTVEIGEKTLAVPVIGDFEVAVYRKALDKSQKIGGAPIALYKTELFACLEGDVPAEVSTEVMKFTGFAQGKCSDEGYTVEIGEKTLKVPIIGDFEVAVYRKALDQLDLM